MSTKTTTTDTAQFDPTSMSTFQGLQPAFRSNLQQFMMDPLQSSFFQTQLQMARQQNRAAFAGLGSQFGQNLAAGGFVGNLPAFQQSQLARQGRALSAADSNAFNNLLLGANQLRFGATQVAGAYRPFETGRTTTQRKSGLGTWLPQIAGAGFGLLGGGMLGGGGISSPFASSGGFGVGAAGLGPMPGSIQPSVYESGNTLVGPSY